MSLYLVYRVSHRSVSSRSFASCLASLFVSFLYPVSSCRVAIRGVRRFVWGVAWMSLSSARGSVPVFLIGLTGEGHEATIVRRFIQLILIHIHGGGFVLMAR